MIRAVTSTAIVTLAIATFCAIFSVPAIAQTTTLHNAKVLQAGCSARMDVCWAWLDAGPTLGPASLSCNGRHDVRWSREIKDANGETISHNGEALLSLFLTAKTTNSEMYVQIRTDACHPIQGFTPLLDFAYIK